MSRSGARLLDLDAFIPRAIEVQFADTVHRIPGNLLTAELVIGMQELGSKLSEGDESAVADLVDLIDGVTLKADPPLSVREMPPTVIAPLAVFLVEGAGGAVEEPDDDPPPKARRPRAASSTTRPSRAQSGRRK